MILEKNEQIETFHTASFSQLDLFIPLKKMHHTHQWDCNNKQKSFKIYTISYKNCCMVAGVCVSVSVRVHSCIFLMRLWLMNTMLCYLEYFVPNCDFHMSVKSFTMNNLLGWIDFKSKAIFEGCYMQNQWKYCIFGKKHHPWGCFIFQIGELDKKFGSDDIQTQRDKQRRANRQNSLKSNMTKWER